HAPIPARVSIPPSDHLSDESRPGTPQSDDLRIDIKKIADKFFVTGSKYADFLDSYVQGKLSLPLTTTGIKGLPKVVRRGADTHESRPNLLFLDLPVPPSSVGAHPPERFRSNVLLGVIEKKQSQDLPVFGVSGCGKTRSVIEMLCLQWGFYFNAAKKDLGSNDLSRLAESIEAKAEEDRGVSVNTIFAKNMTLVLFLSRLLVLKYCLQVPDCRQTFSSASWAILQACPNMFEDVFSELFNVLFNKLHRRVPFELDVTTVIQEELLIVRKLLAAHGYPNFSSETKLRLVVDEAQLLSDKGSELFQSSFMETGLRPMLSPILNGFRKAGDRDLTIIYCGTGLSIRTLHWALSSGEGVKEPRSEMFPYFEFPGWTGRDSIQSYIERVMDQLPDKESKNMLGSLFPPAAIAMLHERLTGRFRPVVTAIEGIILRGDPTEWKSEIKYTEAMITSWKDRERRGNLCGEILRLENKIAQNPKNFTSCSSLRETLGLFLFRYCLLDATEIVLEIDVQLVEAAFGRIKIFGGRARTVLDEPFVLKATFNYFQEKDPSLVSAAERAMLHSDNASVHGNMWEAMMPPVFVETFK
ncbi:hypothetical protein BG011_002071, partial [Mortierella polycephala]